MQQSPGATLAYLFGLGALIGLGQLLKSNERITTRSAAGRAIVVGALSASSTVILLWFPDVPLAAQLGFGAALASLGTDVIVSLLRKCVKR